MNIWAILAIQLLILGCGLAMAAGRCPEEEDRLGAYILITASWTALQVLGFGFDLYRQGWGWWA